MFSKNELRDWLVNVSGHVDKKIDIYLIGGGSMSFQELKEQTKDVDIVMNSRAEFDVLDAAIKKAGFRRETGITDEFYMTALAVYKKDDSRIDVFLKEVGKMLKLTDKMRKRATVFEIMGNVTVNLISIEDIFLFKTMTPRPGDVVDCITLMQRGLDYDAIFEEVLEQSSKEGQWFFWVYEKICAIEEKTLTVSPLKKRIYKLVKDNWDQRPSDFLDAVVDKSKHLP